MLKSAIVTAIIVQGALVSACGGGGSSDETGLPSDFGQPAQDQPPGLSMLTFDHNGTEREYHLHILASYDGSDAVPLLFDFHGLNGTSESQFNRSRFDLIADREG